VTGCIVEDAKIRDYLLNLEHEDGAPKAKFFIARGFAQDEPAPFIAALRRHFLENTPTSKNPDRSGGVRITVDADRRPFQRGQACSDWTGGIRGVGTHRRLEAVGSRLEAFLWVVGSRLESSSTTAFLAQNNPFPLVRRRPECLDFDFARP
jgi:hypothetical protein